MAPTPRKSGIDALHVDWGPDVVTTEWRAGSVQTAGWAITANHGAIAVVTQLHTEYSGCAG